MRRNRLCHEAREFDSGGNCNEWSPHCGAFAGRSISPARNRNEWRGEGPCAELPLSRNDSHFTITSLVGSKRLEFEHRIILVIHDGVSGDRSEMLNKSHSTEVYIKTHELENGDIPQEELEGCILCLSLPA
jgi:hypothetical protein